MLLIFSIFISCLYGLSNFLQGFSEILFSIIGAFEILIIVIVYRYILKKLNV